MCRSISKKKVVIVKLTWYNEPILYIPKDIIAKNSRFPFQAMKWKHLAAKHGGFRFWFSIFYETVKLALNPIAINLPTDSESAHENASGDI